MNDQNENRQYMIKSFLEYQVRLGFAQMMIPKTSTPAVSRKNEDNAGLLESIRDELGDCKRCPLHEGRLNIVFGCGNPEADLMFVGEGPGADEDRQGEPFVGKAGQLLTKMINAMGFDRSEVYITNIVKCRPPGNRDPLPNEIASCLPFLKAQIVAIKPKVIVTLGRIATLSLLNTKDPLSNLRGKFQDFQGIPVMPTYHPSYLLRQQQDKRYKREAWDHLQQVMAILKEVSHRSDANE